MSKTLSSKDRTLAFLNGRPVNRLPFHPIVMRFAARHAGVKYRDFCLSPEAHVDAVIRTAEDFGMDWVSVMSDPYCEAEAYGLAVDYPEDDLPRNERPLVSTAAELLSVAAPQNLRQVRLLGRVRQVELFRQRAPEQFVVGWVEGPFAMVSLFRGLSEACLDLYDHPDAVWAAVRTAVDFAMRFAEAQIAAGADAIGMGDAVCSQISPEHYRKYFWEGEREIIEHIHACGALAKLHICGNTSQILPDMVATGADIVDVDHLAGSMAPAARLLATNQVLCGSVDPVSVVQNGTPERIQSEARKCQAEAGSRCIISAGCEITPSTPPKNLRALSLACLRA
ncbi:MAG: uroporphyrinogen decarboxylase family protein [Armatimonadetes bacterium]|nr:uroporphyrinogen decarboxylase family protein [Armatimonadota bacterium]